jgi:hypothetical protein
LWWVKCYLIFLIISKNLKQIEQCLFFSFYGRGKGTLNNKFSNKFTAKSMFSDEDDEGAFAEL